MIALLKQRDALDAQIQRDARDAQIQRDALDAQIQRDARAVFDCHMYRTANAFLVRQVDIEAYIESCTITRVDFDSRSNSVKMTYRINDSKELPLYIDAARVEEILCEPK